MKALPTLQVGAGTATDARRVRGVFVAAVLLLAPVFTTSALSPAAAQAAPAAAAAAAPGTSVAQTAPAAQTAPEAQTAPAAAPEAQTAPAAAPEAPAAKTPNEVGQAVVQGITLDAAVLPAPASTPSSSRGGGPAAAPASSPAGGGGPAALREGTEAQFRFRLTDADGAPVAGAYPAAWLDLVHADKGGPPPTCEARIKELVEGGLFSQAALDLNVYYVVTLNDDATLSVVDPLFGYGGTKLLAMVALKSPGEDWALDDAIRRLFVALPDSDTVAVVDTATFRVTENLPAGPHPARLALQPDAAYLWVTGEGGGATAVAAGGGAPPKGAATAAGGAAGGGGSLDAFDPRTLARVAHLPIGRGPHDLAFSDDSRFLFVTNRDEGTVSVVDVERLVVAATVPAGRRPVSVGWSRQAQMAYVSDSAAGAITGIAPPDASHPGSPTVRAHLTAEPGLGAVAFPPDGRFGFIVNPDTDQVHILDTAANRIVQTAHVESGPDQIDFSGELAYVHHRGSETVLTIPLKAIGQAGAPVTVMDVPAGQHALGQGVQPTPAAGIVRAPGADAVLIANPADAAVYYYQEGMAAPMGSFHDFERLPRAVQVLDRSLKESAPGTYTTSARLPAGAKYRLAFFLDSPRIVHCFDVDIAADPALAARRIASLPPHVAYLDAKRTAEADRTYTLRFHLSNPATGTPLAGLQDVEVLFYRPPGNNRRTVLAREVDPGTYTADLALGAPGAYSIYVQTLSQNLPFHRAPELVVEAQPTAPPPTPH